ncbi:hypothetical protein FE257_010110 [Aspergillus nanangensis]|uniref:Xylanolytic transcriptional activator regulatory domain-containing protein n=1 Tax=Aspergillus nanangensis TaxID=2582783 RepID=A0AAD4GSD3_ASPNN|nr:hypothetical protein FE257_010110 [Aspergillus nanangensis]
MNAIPFQQHSPGHDEGAGNSPSSIGSSNLPPEVVERLIELYFSKIQGWLPLLHRTRFYAKHRDPHTGHLRNLMDIPPIEAFTLWGMFGLAARFCDMDYFSGTPPAERGDQFVSMASTLYAQLRPTIITPSLEYIQGCILLAFNYYTACLCHRGWMITGSCVRLAYELDLHIIDKDGGRNLSPSDWVTREEKRRSWWLIWQLDRFGSNMTHRPYAIDNRVMSVLLPASDSDWLRGIPVPSAMLEGNPESIWRSLKASGNQNTRIWFIACEYLMSLVHEQIYQGTPSEDEIQQWKTVLSCFRLALPPAFCLNLDTFVYDVGDVDEMNWVILTHLLLLFRQFELEFAVGDTTSCPTITAAGHAQRIQHIISSWSPEYIQLSHPFAGCSLIGPKAGYFTAKIHKSVERHWALAREILRLGLSHISRFWKLGSVLLELEGRIKSGETLSGRIPPSARRLNALLPVLPEKGIQDDGVGNIIPEGDLAQNLSTSLDDCIVGYSPTLRIDTPRFSL